jgi:hypothetical protein
MKTGKWLMVITILILGIGTIQADFGSDRVLRKQSRKEMLSKLTKGTTFQAGGNEYVILPELTLKPMQHRGKSGIQENELGVLGQQKIVKETKKVKDSAGAKAQSSSIFNMRTHTSSSGILSKPIPNDRLVKRQGTVVLNKQTGRFGLMTGNIIVQYRAGTDASALAKEVHLRNFKDFPHLKTVFFIIPAGRDIFQIAAKLKKQNGVAIVETEVVEHFATPQ